MRYYVIGIDGNKYGPCEESVLRDWAREGRLTPESTLIDEEENMFKAKQIITNFPVSVPAFVNDSGTGANAVLPQSLKGLNWGGFLLYLFWGIAHKTKYGYAMLIMIISSIVLTAIAIAVTFLNPLYGNIISFIINPISSLIGLAMTVIEFIFLFKGNEIAWQSRRFESISQFKEVQRKWLRAGLIVLAANILLVFIIIAAFVPFIADLWTQMSLE